MAAILDGKTLYLTGAVGDGWFDEESFNSIDVLIALAGLKPSDDITAHLNSPGGVASEGAAIYAMLSARPGRVDIVVDGIAVSAASLIAMAGKTVSMSSGAVMMIHDPSGFTQGNSAVHGKTIEALEALATAYAGVYATKSGKSAAECREIMKAETWFTPEEAIAAGFADEAVQPTKAVMVAAFDYSKFLHAPHQLVALAREKKWTAHQPAPTKQPGKETTMSKDNQAHAAATARIKAIMKADEAEGRTELAEHLAYETDLSPEAAISVMSAAPKGASEYDADEYRPRRTMNAHGLNKEFGSPTKGATRLVTAMKQRHGVK